MPGTRRFAVVVMPREDLQDPQGVAVRDALRTLGYEGVLDCRVGKVMHLTVAEGVDAAVVHEMASRLLANPVTETFHVREE